MGPLVGAEPCRSHHPEGTGNPVILGHAVPPDVRIVVAHKAPAAVHFLCRLFSVRQHGFQKGKQRHMAFGKIAVFRQPVVHFRVDVDGVFTVPGRVHVLVPDTLQGCRKSAFPAAGNEKIPTEIKV